jgi:hypothetical protein
MAGDSETGSEANGVERRCWGVPSWLETARPFTNDKSATQFLATDDDDS